MLRNFIAIILSAVFLSASSPPAVAQTDPNGKRLETIREYLTEAGALYKKQEFADSGKKIRAAQALLERALRDATEADRETFMKEYSRIAKAHELLAKEDITLPELAAFPDKLGEVEDEADAAGAGGEGEMPAETGGNDEPAADAVSFRTEIEPLLVKNCGICHVAGSRGRFNIRNFDSLLAAASGKAVVAGHPDDSRIVEEIESGRMPPNRKLPPDELALIKKWIEQGANFDGTDRSAQFGSQPNGLR